MVTGGIGIGADSFFGGSITSAGTITTSDRSLKENISTLEDPSDLVSKINVVTYSYISERNKQSTNKMRIGVIAQEVNEIFPNTVHSDNSGKLAVDYTSLFCALIKTVQVQKNTISNLETEISNIKKHLNM